jgi:hypothetical protein
LFEEFRNRNKYHWTRFTSVPACLDYFEANEFVPKLIPLNDWCSTVFPRLKYDIVSFVFEYADTHKLVDFFGAEALTSARLEYQTKLDTFLQHVQEDLEIFQHLAQYQKSRVRVLAWIKQNFKRIPPDNIFFGTVTEVRGDRVKVIFDPESHDGVGYLNYFEAEFTATRVDKDASPLWTSVRVDENSDVDSDGHGEDEEEDKNEDFDIASFELEPSVLRAQFTLQRGIVPGLESLALEYKAGFERFATGFSRSIFGTVKSMDEIWTFCRSIIVDEELKYRDPNRVLFVAQNFEIRFFEAQLLRILASCEFESDYQPLPQVLVDLCLEYVFS